MNRCLFIFFVLLFGGLGYQARAQPQKLLLDDAFYGLQSQSRLARYLGGSLSFLGGGASALSGVALQMDGQSPLDETLIGFAGTAIGTAMAVDGLTRIFGLSSAERLAVHYHHFPKGTPKEYGGNKTKEQYGVSVLESLASDARNYRRIRSVLDAGLAGCFWYLYAKGRREVDANGKVSGNDIYPKLLVPGIFFSAVALYRFILSSPEERAWKDYQNGKTANVSSALDWHFSSRVSSDGALFVATLSF